MNSFYLIQIFGFIQTEMETTYSINESYNLLQKTIRGSGKSWGFSEELAEVICRLERRGFPSAEIFCKQYQRN